MVLLTRGSIKCFWNYYWLCKSFQKSTLKLRTAHGYLSSSANFKNLKLFKQRTTNNVPNLKNSSVSIEWWYGMWTSISEFWYRNCFSWLTAISNKRELLLKRRPFDRPKYEKWGGPTIEEEPPSLLFFAFVDVILFATSCLGMHKIVARATF